ncbi:isoprenylcysteine carboxylmethyltransferase family protein [Variovorax sp. RTB1]|uniref:methyltransferase family protein n=1 Tax=Variovorax sp. RTB1 TaxID=3048631 RepID=UPI002B22BAB0|nr:isoprenylcysteine carboxylmethyltransferase family protein [Variovorax sp. RTB1]MEB0114103.1 isoprenylcysteine carboxylmethyltransferase family protein [Variovorax sp. RTB1]
MKRPDQPASKALALTLVTLQFALLAALVAAAIPSLMQPDGRYGAWLAFASGGGLGAWSLAANRIGNFNIRPIPRQGGLLICSGPYRWIRHPMYSAVMLVGLGCALAARGNAFILALALEFALFGVLLAKAVVEEHWMQLSHPAYAAYKSRTKRFLPGVF